MDHRVGQTDGHDDTGLGASEPVRTALAAATAADVEVADIADLATMQSVCRLLDEVQRPAVSVSACASAAGSAGSLTPESLVALAQAGNQVTVARRDGSVVGSTVAHRDGQTGLHSRLTVVRDENAGRGVGRALKWHQRAWCSERGIDRVRWHGDPLNRRTAVFDLVVLGARMVAYERDLDDTDLDDTDLDDTDLDGRGSAVPRDRVVVEWDLGAPRVVSAASGRRASPDAAALRRAGAQVALSIADDTGPRIHDVGGPRRLVRIPADIEAIREHAPDEALAWTLAIRATLGRSLNVGARVTGITRDGWYVLSDDTAVAELRARP